MEEILRLEKVRCGFYAQSPAGHVHLRYLRRFARLTKRARQAALQQQQQPQQESQSAEAGIVTRQALTDLLTYLSIDPSPWSCPAHVLPCGSVGDRGPGALRRRGQRVHRQREPQAAAAATAGPREQGAAGLPAGQAGSGPLR